MSQNLVERLQEVINEAKDALRISLEMDSRPNAGLAMMKLYILEAEKAQVGGDVVAMLRAVKNLESYGF